MVEVGSTMVAQSSLDEIVRHGVRSGCLSWLLEGRSGWSFILCDVHYLLGFSLSIIYFDQ